MSRTIRDYSPTGWVGGKAGRDGQCGKGYGWEYWSRRPLPYSSPSKEAKRIIHGIERAMRRRLLIDLERKDSDRAYAELQAVSA